MNQSYKKEYNEKGECINGYKGDYLHTSPNRQQRRRADVNPSVVRTNRKSTRGRNIYVQNVNEVVGTKEVVRVVNYGKNKQKVLKTINIVKPTGKTIKHVLETPNALLRKVALFNFFSRIEMMKAKWHKNNPEYQAKQK